MAHPPVSPNFDEGYRDGLHGHKPTNASPNYTEGYEAGRKAALSAATAKVGG